LSIIHDDFGLQQQSSDMKLVNEGVPLEEVVDEFFADLLPVFDSDGGFGKTDDGFVGELDQGLPDVRLQDRLATVDALLTQRQVRLVFLQVLQVVASC
jgi:hypothetical protein